MNRLGYFLAVALAAATLLSGCKDSKQPAEAGPSPSRSAAKDKAAGNSDKARRVEWYCADEADEMPCLFDPDICSQANSNTPCMPTSPVHCFSYRHEDKGDSMSCHAKAELCAAAHGKRQAESDPKVANLSGCASRD